MSNSELIYQIANRLVSARCIFKPHSASAFAKELGIKQATYSNYENGTRAIPNDIYEKLQKEYNINLNWLISGIGEMFLTETHSISRKTPDNDAVYWLHNWGERLLAVQKFFGYSDEKMAKILGVNKIRYIELITKSPFPKEQELNAFKDNFLGVTVDELLYDDSKTFYSKLKKDDKLDIDLSNLPPEKLIQIKNLLKEI